MYFARFGAPGAEFPAVQEGRHWYDLRPLTGDIDGAFLAADGIGRTRTALAEGLLPGIDVTGLRHGSPITRPGKIVCIGLNYRDHAEETGAEVPAEPVIFMKASNTMIGPDDEVLVPRGSKATDYEVELAVVIGRTARYLADEKEAAGVIAGYAISNDVSERDFQLHRGGQWDKGKSCETFNPLGPVLRPAEEIPDPQNLTLRLSVNGEVRQEGNTKNMLFGVHHVIWYLSQFMVLEPGDVVNTGTPAGVALGLSGAPYLQPGDVVDVSIEGLGAQRQTFGAA
jgi:2-keto-4-pentenoate hydratase/2-oxohepta-3-ene-1,7-dioic acid hydratase in catechol pathway